LKTQSQINPLYSTYRTNYDALSSKTASKADQQFSSYKPFSDRKLTKQLSRSNATKIKSLPAFVIIHIHNTQHQVLISSFSVFVKTATQRDRLETIPILLSKAGM